MRKVTLGGERLGSGNKTKVELKSYNRSTHDLGNVERTTMAAGTIVPIWNQLALPGDTWDIGLDLEVLTHPTIGPLYGTYKAQVDVFIAPIRLYIGALNNNQLGIGMEMQNIHFPQIQMVSVSPSSATTDWDNSQINPSSIFAYQGIRGLGKSTLSETGVVMRDFNAIPWLVYLDAYKNYYANKQEGVGAVIHNASPKPEENVSNVWVKNANNTDEFQVSTNPNAEGKNFRIGWRFVVTKTTGAGTTPDDIYVLSTGGISSDGRVGRKGWRKMRDIFPVIETVGLTIIGSGTTDNTWYIYAWRYRGGTDTVDTQPRVFTFPLDDIDKMRRKLLIAPEEIAFKITNQEDLQPFRMALTQSQDNLFFSKMSSQEGLCVKTYQSDMNNAWLKTEWIDGENGINNITRIDTSDGFFSIDTLNLSRKVYDMLNRIAVSGGTYDDWIDTVYSNGKSRAITTPMYMGGLSKELVFQEVIATTATTDGAQPLGQLGGRGVMSSKNKGGNVYIKVDEPSYIMINVSLTPRVDYSQGNKWDMNLKTMNDLHKPQLDEIGFQDLITDKLAWWDTRVQDYNEPIIFKSAGKQPAWINYMSNTNRVTGNFAVQDSEMFMTLNRRYTPSQYGHIADLTTYVDPAKFNNIFADTARDAQNFWVQLGVRADVRRVMSAKVMPNL